MINFEDFRPLHYMPSYTSADELGDKCGQTCQDPNCPIHGNKGDNRNKDRELEIMSKQIDALREEVSRLERELSKYEWKKLSDGRPPHPGVYFFLDTEDGYPYWYRVDTVDYDTYDSVDGYSHWCELLKEPEE